MDTVSSNFLFLSAVALSFSLAPSLMARLMNRAAASLSTRIVAVTEMNTQCRLLVQPSTYASLLFLVPFSISGYIAVHEAAERVDEFTKSIANLPYPCLPIH